MTHKPPIPLHALTYTSYIIRVVEIIATIL